MLFRLLTVLLLVVVATTSSMAQLVRDYSSYWGGNDRDDNFGVAVGADGNSYFIGVTESKNFPTTSGAIGRQYMKDEDVFVTAVSPEGKVLWSTILGSEKEESECWAIATTKDGRFVYVAFATEAKSLGLVNPATAEQTTNRGDFDVVLVKLRKNGGLAWATYLGGKKEDEPVRINTTASGGVIVSGRTKSEDFPTKNAIDNSENGGWDGFVTQYDRDGTMLMSTYLGGDSDDYVYETQEGTDGYLYALGSTWKTNWLPSPRRTGRGGADFFVYSFKNSTRRYTTYIGGSDDEFGAEWPGIALDKQNHAYISGRTESNNYPTVNAVQSSIRGGRDGVVTGLDAAGNIKWSTYIGGSSNDEFSGITYENGLLYVGGSTESNNIAAITPATAIQSTANSRSDGMLFTFRLDGTVSNGTYYGSSADDEIHDVDVNSGRVTFAGHSLGSGFPTQNPAQVSYGGGSFDGQLVSFTAPSLFATLQSESDASSCTAQDGIVRVRLNAAQLGTPPYDISVDNGKTYLSKYSQLTPNASRTISLTDLQWGAYVVVVRDALGRTSLVGEVQIGGCVYDICSATNDNQIQVPVIPGATGYTWTTDIGSVASGQNTRTIRINTDGLSNNSTGQVCVTPDGPGCMAPPVCVDIRVVCPVCDPFTNAGTIAGNQSRCGGYNPSNITSSAGPSGGSGGSTQFIWQRRNGTSGAFTTIAGATAATYDPPTITQTTQFRRGTRRSTLGCTYSYSNVVTKTVSTNVTNPGTLAGNQTNCGTYNPTAITGSAASGGNGAAILYQWQSSTNNASWSNISGATGINYDPPSISATRYYRRAARRNTSGCGWIFSSSVVKTVIQNVTNAGTIAGNQDRCGGYNPTTITSSSAASGGSGGTISYRWQVRTGTSGAFTNIPSATGATYDPPAITQTTQYRRAAFRSGGCSWQPGNIVTKTVTQNVTNAGTIAGNQDRCGGYNPSAITSSAAASGGSGAGIVYQWQSSPNNSTWTNIGGATAATYDPPAITATTYYRRAARRNSNGCGWIFSASVSKQVTQNVTNAGALTGNQDRCGGYNPSNITATAASGGSGASIRYQWQSSANNSTWANIGGATGSTYDPPAITATTYYRRAARRNTGACGWIYSASVRKQVTQNVTSPGALTGNEDNCGGYDPANITGTNASGGSGAAVRYVWQSSPNNSTWTTISGATATSYNPPAITATTYYRRGARRNTSACSWVWSSTITKAVTAPLTNAGTIAGNQNVCGGYNPTAITSGSAASGGSGAGISYQWQQRAGTSGTWANISGATAATYDPGAITATMQYRRRARRNAGSGSCAWVNTGVVTKTVTAPVTNAGAIAGNENRCGGYNPAAITSSSAASGGSGTGITYLWQSRTGTSGAWANVTSRSASNLTYDPPAITATTQYRRGAIRYPGGAGCAWRWSSVITKTVTQNVTNAGTIAGNQDRCGGYNPSAITSSAAASGGSGAGIVYQWQSSPNNSTWTNISGATSTTYDPPAITATRYYRRAARRNTSACGWLYTASVRKQVTQNVIAAGTIAGAQDRCGGYNPSAITSSAAATGGSGAGIRYQWQVSTNNSAWTNISGATSATYDPPAITATRFYRRAARRNTSACGWLYTASVRKQVSENLTSGGTIAGTEDNCGGYDPATIASSAAATGGSGAGIRYQWQSSSDNTTWTNISGATSATYNPPAITATTYYQRAARRNTTDCGWVWSNSIVKTVTTPVTSGGTITGAQDRCGGYDPSPITSSALATGGSGAPVTYDWFYRTGTSGSWTRVNARSATFTTYDPPAITATTQYRRGAIRFPGGSGCTWEYSNIITKQVTQNVTAAGTIAGAQDRCGGYNPSAITSSAAATGGSGAGIRYQWQVSTNNSTWTNISGATSTTYDPPAITATRFYRRAARRNTSACGWLYTASVRKQVTENVTNSGTLTGNEDNCGGYDPANITGTNASGGSGAAVRYVWQSSPNNSTWTTISGATATSYNPPAITATTYYRRGARRNTSACSWVWSSTITKTVTAPLTNAGTIAGNQNLCGGYNPTAITSGAVASGGSGASISYQWQQRTGTSGTWANISGATAATYDPGAITATMQYRRRARRNAGSGSCAWVNTAAVTKTVTAPVTNAGAIAGNENACGGYNPAAITSSGAASGGSGTGITYLWQSRTGTSGAWANVTSRSASNLTYDPPAITATTQYRRGAIRYPGGAGCAWSWSAAITKTVTQNVTAAGALTGNEDRCGGYNPSNITATVASGGSGAGIVYQWQSSPNNSTWTNIGGATAATYDPPTITSTTYYRRAARRNTSACGWIYSASVRKRVSQNFTNPGAIAGNESRCTGFDPGVISSSSLPTGGAGAGARYQWQQRVGSGAWTNISSSNSATYDPPAITETTDYRRGARRNASSGCAYVYSGVVTKTVIDPVTSAGAIAGNQTRCGGYNPSNITSSTAASGGAGHPIVYAWQYRNGTSGAWVAVSGATAATYDPPAITGTRQYRRMASRSDGNGGCTWLYSNVITKTVSTNFTNPGTLAGAEDECGGYDPSTITSSAAPSGGSGPSVRYQWQVSTDNSSWTNIGGATASTYNPPAITATRYYRRAARRNASGCGWIFSASIRKQVTVNVTSPGALTGNEDNCGGYDPAAISATNATGGSGAGIIYRWQQRVGTGSWTWVSGATSATYNPPAIIETTQYRRTARRNATSPCSWSISNVVTKTVTAPLTNAGTIAGNQDACGGYNPTAITSSAAASGGSGAGISYQWQQRTGTSGTWANISGATSAAYDPGAITATMQYRRRARRNAGSGSCAWVNTAPVTKTVTTPVTDAGAIAGNEDRCGGYNPAAITSSSLASGGSGTGITYDWFYRTGTSGAWSRVNARSATFTTYDPPAITATTQYRRGAIRFPGGAGCSWEYSNIITKTVSENVTNPGTIAGNQDRCGGYNPGAITSSAAASGGSGAGIVYQWQSSPNNSTWTDIGGATAATYDPPSITATMHYRRAARRNTSACGWIYSASVRKRVTQNVTNSGTITGNEDNCGGYDPANITATAATGGSGAAVRYVWQSSPNNSTWTTISGATATSYDPSAITATTYYRRGARRNTGACGWVWSNSIVKTVTAPLTNAGTIAGNQNVCGGYNPTAITSGAAASGGSGAGISYQWQQRTGTSGAWANISGATAATHDPGAITETMQYRRRARRNAGSGSCAWVNTAAVTKTVTTPVTNAGVIAGNENACGGYNPAAITSSSAASGGSGTGISYQWQQRTGTSGSWTNISGATAATYDPGAITATMQYRRAARRNAGSGTCAWQYSGVVTKTVTVPVTNAGTIAGNENRCGGYNPTAITSSAAASGGSGTGISYQWQQRTGTSGAWANISGATAATHDPGAITGTMQYRRAARRNAGSGSCAWQYSNAVTKTVTIQLTTVGTVAGNQDNCGPFDPAAFTSVAAASGGSGATVEYRWQYRTGFSGSWTSIPSSNATTYDPGNLTETTQYRRIARRGTCSFTSTGGNVITVTVNPVATLSAGANQTICEGETATLTTSVSGGTAPFTYAWSGGLGGGATVSATPAITTTYTVTATDARGCTVTDNVVVNVNEVPTATATVANPTSCGSSTGSVTFSFPDVAARTGIKLSINGGSTFTSVADNLGSYTFTALPAGGYDLFVQWGNDDCPVDLADVVLSDPSAPVAAFTSSGANDCDGTTESFTATAVAGATYTWSFGSDATPSSATGRTATASFTTSAGVQNIPVTLTVEANGCTSSVTQSVRRRTSSNDQITSASETGPTTCGGSDGRIDFVAANPSGSCLEFSHDGTTWTTSRSITGLSAGTYTLRSRYCNNECEEVYGDFTLSDPVAPTVSVGSSITVCDNAPTPLSAVGAGGTAPYSFAWNNGAGSGASVTVSPGTDMNYTVTLTDAAGCTATATKQVAVMEGEVSALQINDLTGGTNITINDGNNFHLSNLPSSWNIEAMTSMAPAKVNFNLTGPQSMTKDRTAAPYQMDATDAHLGLTAGTYRLRTQVYAHAGAGAPMCSEETIEFYLENYEICVNGIDDDGDGATDCDDESCPNTPGVDRVEQR